MAVSSYDLRELRKLGFAPGLMKLQYEKILKSYDIYADISIGRYARILDFIEKHGPN